MYIVQICKHADWFSTSATSCCPLAHAASAGFPFKPSWLPIVGKKGHAWLGCLVRVLCWGAWARCLVWVYLSGFISWIFLVIISGSGSCMRLRILKGLRMFFCLLSYSRCLFFYITFYELWTYSSYDSGVLCH